MGMIGCFESRISHLGDEPSLSEVSQILDMMSAWFSESDKIDKRILEELNRVSNLARSL